MADRQATPLVGTISLATPTSWHLLGACLVAAVALGAGFLTTVEYARTETVSGSFVLDKGSIGVMPSRPGVVTELLVKEGEAVRAGQRLAAVRTDEADRDGASVLVGTLATMDQQRASLELQSSAIDSAAMAERQRSAAQAGSLQTELGLLDEQIGLQKRLVDGARQDLAQIKELAARGFISRRDQRSREDLMLSRSQQLAAMEQSRAQKRSEMELASARARTSLSDAGPQRIASEIAQLQLDGARLQMRNAGAYSLVASVDGRVTAIEAHPGDAIGPDRPVMTIVPRGARLVARLSIPDRAVPFVRSGQRVGLRPATFAEDRSFSLPATVETLTSVPAAEETRGAAPTGYVAMAALSRADGTPGRSFVAGMSLKARIVTERRKLWTWLLPPDRGGTGR